MIGWKLMVKNKILTFDVENLELFTYEIQKFFKYFCNILLKSDYNFVREASIYMPSLFFYSILKSVLGHDQVFVKKSHVYGILRYKPE